MMLFILLLIITQIIHTDTIETTSPVSVTFDGFTVESWNQEYMWNKTRKTIVEHLNNLCRHDTDCDADYGIDNIHLLETIRNGSSSICMTITADKPLLNETDDNSIYNYTALLTSALLQAKIDVEHLHDNQLLTTITYATTHSHQNSVINRTSRLLSVLLGISIIAIVFSLTICCFQRIRQHHYSKLLQVTQTRQEPQDENAQSISVLHK
ncbi:unnamed protein product [Adineta steineri]|uniref:Uncharacterized protein n=1 Tax=Adineta steineri TaxID=433720 RepID=A0A819EB06_9BILA|nr:unnamed protein product [Adineta steineri]CAF1280815.1 unnamed protein product [Adineta steineri]CAF3770295.1 unnamed protein product [Adineta steineri]CAF3792751.1 unnamed protein product [Adineta steineri]CAF3847633.1 unnamed protein product [Adineta steineri]